MNIFKFFLPVFLIFFSFKAFSESLTLAEVYEIALKEDPQLKIAQATYKANKEAKAKGIAGLLPTITTRATTNWNESEVIKGGSVTFDEEGSSGSNSYSYSADLIQPIFRLDRWFQFGQGRAMSEVAKAQFGYAQQETILRVTETYFNLLKAKKDLEVARSEEAAIKKQRDRSKRLFEEGVSSVTEFQEAQAFYDLAKVSTIAGEGQFEFAREALIAIIGEAPELKDLSQNFPISTPNPKSQEEWVALALSNNYLLKAAQMSTAAAARNARSNLSNHLPDVDHITRNTDRTISGFSGNGFSFDETEIENTRYSLQFSWPLMAGGLVSSERREAYALLEKAKQEEILAERSTIRDVKSRFASVLTNLANVKARNQALTSSELALKATRFGYDSDTRNIVDLLNAEKSFFSAQRDLNSARYDFILSEFALKIASGSLSPRDVYDLSNFMTE